MNVKRVGVAVVVGLATGLLGFKLFPSAVKRERYLFSSLTGVAGFEATRFVQSFIPDTSVSST